MEIIAEFNDLKGFNLKLTQEKIFVKATGIEETFALRSVSGIGLYDDLETYNEELDIWKKKSEKGKAFGWLWIILGAILLIQIIVTGAFDMIIVPLLVIPLGIYLLTRATDESKKPKLNTYFKLMISGGQRQFAFNKSSKNAPKIAHFINKVEDTLTAYK